MRWANSPCLLREQKLWVTSRVTKGQGISQHNLKSTLARLPRPSFRESPCEPRNRLLVLFWTKRCPVPSSISLFCVAISFTEGKGNGRKRPSGIHDCETRSYLENDGTCTSCLPQKHMQEKGKARQPSCPYISPCRRIIILQSNCVRFRASRFPCRTSFFSASSASIYLL